MSSSLSNRLSHIFSHLNSERLKIVVTRDLGPDVMTILYSESAKYEIVLWPGKNACDRKWLLDNVRDALALIVLVTDRIDAEVLDAAGSQLKVVSTMSVGYEHISVPDLAKRNIRLGYTPDVLTDAVADISIMLALMAGRLAKETTLFVSEGNWPTYSWAPFAFCGSQISATPSSPKRTAGFLGFGRIAQATLRRLLGFGFTHCVYTSNPFSKPSPERDSELLSSFGAPLHSLKRVSLDELASESDVLFVLTPGGDETKGLINEAFLKKMKKTAVLVNSSRGTVVDSDALAKALKEGWIWGAGLDVIAGEPNVAGDHALVREPRCVVLPHIGSATVQTRLDMATLAVQNALAALNDQDMPASVNVTL
ncbi:hypothetical protein CPB83DRAFT_896787 [Crepidotus variabilis]|uniref:Glyoxylate reductase n=1 Tax=Crepidotus variabilis TaxID=179855 RepID=A0A9P6EB00_9AGAR|nr:hypothetical protein CPB83DRAFT_896787 [Crepidotus variabilis]